MANENRQKMLKKRNHTAVLDRHTSAFNMESLVEQVRVCPKTSGHC